MDDPKQITEYTPRELRLLAEHKEFWIGVKFFNEAENHLIQAEESGARKQLVLDAIAEVQAQLKSLVVSAHRYWEAKRDA